MNQQVLHYHFSLPLVFALQALSDVFNCLFRFLELAASDLPHIIFRDGLILEDASRSLSLLLQCYKCSNVYLYLTCDILFKLFNLMKEFTALN